MVKAQHDARNFKEPRIIRYENSSTSSIFMVELPILSLDELCPRIDLDLGIDEGIDSDFGVGTYLKICRQELVPIAVVEMGRYSAHDLVSLEEAQKRYVLDRRIAIVPVKEWYDSCDT